MPVPGVVQSATIWNAGPWVTNGNWTSALTANTAGTPGAEVEVARYVPGAALTLKFTAGTKIGPTYLDDTGGAQVDIGTLTLAVVRPDGSRKIIAIWPNTSFGTVAAQRDVNFRPAYQMTQFCNGNIGEYVVLFLDSDDPLDFDDATNTTNFPYTYRQG